MRHRLTKVYEAPCLEVLEISPERGFAGSEVWTNSEPNEAGSEIQENKSIWIF